MQTAAQLCQSLFDSHVVQLVVDLATRRVVAVNARGTREAGHDPAEVVGAPIADVLRMEDDSPELELDAAESEGARLAWLTRRDGTRVRVDVAVARFQCSGEELALLSLRSVEPPPLPGAESLLERDDFPTIVGQSAKVRDLCRRIGSIAKSDVTVLIQGESGTGKEIVANAIHAHSHRGLGPLVKVNCAALTETLLESELFGHVRGAFTGAIRDRRGRFMQADGGTLFLDEIGSMSLSGQAKLLRVLQEHEFEPVGSSQTVPVNARVIAATNVDLAKAVAAGTFREDLYYRLNVFQLRLAPLRERTEDILVLARHFLSEYARAHAKEIPLLTLETSDLLLEYAWPGNVRELKNAVEHAVIMTTDGSVSPSSLPLHIPGIGTARGSSPRPAEPRLRDRLNDFERQVLLSALERAGGVKKRAAAILGVDARNLPYLLRKHRLSDSSAAPEHEV
jgi:transcriptional regulator with GAF, ATPase, and Fis domain